MPETGLTMSDLIQATGLKKSTISSRLSRLGIKPLSYEALYPPDTLERILTAKRGRPPKAKPETPDKPKKGKK
jgi:hypothetical protein